MAKKTSKAAAKKKAPAVKSFPIIVYEASEPLPGCCGVEVISEAEYFYSENKKNPMRKADVLAFRKKYLDQYPITVATTAPQEKRDMQERTAEFLRKLGFVARGKKVGFHGNTITLWVYISRVRGGNYDDEEYGEEDDGEDCY